MFCVVLMVLLMCKIVSLLCGVQMILDTLVLYGIWYHTTKDMKYHIISHDVFVTSWDYTDCSCMIASCMFCAGVLKAYVIFNIVSLLCGVHISTTRGGAIIAPQHVVLIAIFEMGQ